MKSGREVAMRLAVLLLVCASASHAQFWKNKDYSKWSLEECRFLIGSNSPWSSTYAIGVRRDPHLQPETQVGEEGPYLEYTATIKSAWTYRQSWLRMMQLEPWVKNAYIEKRFAPEHMAISVDYSATLGYRTASTRFWKTQTQEELLRQITLVADGKRIQPLKVESKTGDDDYFNVALGGSFEITFPRQVEGKPILTPDMKKVYLEIADPNGKVRLPFNVKKMVVNGEVVY